MPQIKEQCEHCGSYSTIKQPLYRRETISHTKKSKWIRLSGFVYCTECKAVSIIGYEYKDVKLMKGNIIDKMVIVPKNNDEIEAYQKEREDTLNRLTSRFK